MPPKSTKTNPAPQVAPQAGLHSRRTMPVTTRSGRVTGTTTFTQDPSPNEEYFSEDGDFEEEPEEVEYDDDVAVDDPFATWDSEGYSLTYAGAHDPEGRDSPGPRTKPGKRPSKNTWHFCSNKSWRMGTTPTVTTPTDAIPKEQVAQIHQLQLRWLNAKAMALNACEGPEP